MAEQTIPFHLNVTAIGQMLEASAASPKALSAFEVLLGEIQIAGPFFGLRGASAAKVAGGAISMLEVLKAAHEATPDAPVAIQPSSTEGVTVAPPV